MDKKPVVLVVMDGVGESPVELGNMVMKATTPTLDELKASCPFQVIKAHGSSNAEAIENAVLQAKQFALSGIIDDIEKNIDLMKVEKE